jgi:biopolymer transport protein ExbD
MRIRDRRADDVPEINLVPLIDVILVLIIFFVITTTFDARSVLRVELPRATGEANTGSDSLSLLINAEGRYFVDDREALRTDVESLKRTLLEVAGVVGAGVVACAHGGLAAGASGAVALATRVNPSWARAS